MEYKKGFISMKKIILILIILLVFLFNIIFAKDYPDELERKTIKSISDGDTFKVKYNRFIHTIRLYGIDAPEMTNENKYWSIKAKEELTLLIAEKKVDINILRKSGNGHRYDGIVYVGQGKGKEKLNVNEELLKRGYAIVAEKYCGKKYLERYLKLQAEASNTQAGFWKDKEYYPKIKKMIDKYKVKEKTK